MKDYDKGFIRGFEEASKASYRDLMAAINMPFETLLDDAVEGEATLDAIPNWAQPPYEIDYSLDWKSYVEGWHQGCMKFWNEIKKEI